MQPGNYQIKDGNTTVAYLRVTPTGTTWTPKGVKGTALNDLQQAVEQGSLPDGLTAKEITVATGFNRPRPDWRELTPSTWKRQRWLKARGKV